MFDIETIKRNGLCAGCGLCAGIGDAADPAIVMEDSSEGYRRPVARRAPDAEQARLIDAACPGANIRHDPAEHEAEYHPIWGPLIKVRLGWSTDPALRRNASSGGGLSAILTHLLNTGEIDYVVQTSVSDASPIRNAIKVSTGRDDVFQAAGSRYAPSSPLQDVGARLDRAERFAFVGKPCDVAGLRQLARHDRRVNETVPYMIAFMCAGVPSYRGTSALLQALGIEDESEVVAFRYRGDGWPGFATAELADGRKLRMDYETSWGGILNKHLQFRCKICPDGIGEFADIVCADGWRLDEQGTASFEESDGRSLILTRTRKGEDLIKAMIVTGAIETEPTTTDAMMAMQPYQALRKGFVWSRLLAMTAMGKRRPRFSNLELARNSRRFGLARGFKSMTGMVLRLARGTQTN